MWTWKEQYREVGGGWWAVRFVSTEPVVVWYTVVTDMPLCVCFGMYKGWTWGFAARLGGRE